MDAATRAIDPTLPPKAKLLTGKTSSGWHNRLFWQVFSAAFNYGFYVEREGVRVHTGNAEHETAPAAEKAAAAFCREWIEENAESDDAPVSVSGWHVVSIDDEKGTYGAELHDPVTGVIVAGPVSGDAWSGYETAGAACQAATEWAWQNPTPSCAARDEADGVKADAFCAGWALTVEESSNGKFEAILVDVQTGEPGAIEEDFGGFDTFADAMQEASGWAGRHPTPTHQLPAPAPAPAADPALDTLALGESAELARLRALLAQRDADVAQALEQRDAALAGIAADMRKGGDDATEYRKLALQKRDELNIIASSKDRIKNIDVRMGELGIGLVDLVEGMATGTLGKAYQQTLTFDSSSSVRASVQTGSTVWLSKASPADIDRIMAGASDAPAAALGTQKWAFNGVEYVIESSNEDGPQGLRFTTWIKGHRDTTEGYGETYEQAVGHTQAAASVVFENLEPGEVTPAPPVRMPTKKAKLKGHDVDAVTSALESSLSLLDAAEALKVNVPKLEAFLKKQGIVISKHLAKHAGEEQAAPAQKKRGRKPKAQGSA